MPTMESDHLARIRAFCDRAEDLEVQGLDFQHAAICRRRCWLHLHRASMNEWSDLIRLGEVLHVHSHSRDRSIAGLTGLKPDRLDWERRIVVEEKSSKSHSEAAHDQLSFYAALMTRVSGRLWSGRLYVLGARRYWDVALDDARLTRLEASLDLIASLKKDPKVPPASRLQACNGCSNSEFCGFARR
jgi:CRISPR-associated exonuclease Cas4